MTTDPRDHLVLVLDIERLEDALAYAERMAPWFGIAKVGYELYGVGGAGSLRSPAAQGLPGVRRPEAPRHPDHRRTWRARARPPRRRVPELPRGGRRDDVARRSRRLPRRRARSRTRATDRARGHRAHERHECRHARTAHADRRGRRMRRRRVRRSRHSARPSAQSRERWCPASGSPVATRTIRRASTRPVTRSAAVPTGSSSAAQSRRRTTPNWRRKRLRAMWPPRSPARRVDRLHEKVVCVY